MTKFQNMKVEINEQQPLDEVVKELERLGYKLTFKTQCLYRFVYTTQGGKCYISVSDLYLDKTTTLAQLKEMK